MEGSKLSSLDHSLVELSVNVGCLERILLKLFIGQEPENLQSDLVTMHNLAEIVERQSGELLKPYLETKPGIVGILTDEQIEAGLSLQEADDHTLNLLHHNKIIVRFSSTGAKPDFIRKAAQEVLNV